MSRVKVGKVPASAELDRARRLRELQAVCQRRTDLDQDRLHKELEHIQQYDLIDQFFSLHQLGTTGHENRVNSLVAYALGITDAYPEGEFIPHKRFINARVTMPDIDLDYPDDRRQEMIEYTLQKYGSDKVAQIITFGTLGARAAIRDVGRALDVPLPEVDALARMVSAVPGKPVTISDCLDSEHEVYSADLAEAYKQKPYVQELLDTASDLEGIARHASTHAAGVIIADKPIVEYTPLHRPTKGGDKGGIGVVTQFPMEILDSIGLLKVDFLGLSMLTVMRQACELIAQRHGIRLDLNNIPYDRDHPTPDPSKPAGGIFELLSSGDVLGIFQVEGVGMRRVLTELKPQKFDHVIAVISLFRPGPMENIPAYIKRMHGKEPVEYHHPDLEPVLGETYGIIVYQEQIIQLAVQLAGYEPGEADMIRKAVSKKKKDQLEKHRLQFTQGGMERGYSQEVCEAIWGDIEYFARYGFNKCLPGDVKVMDAATGRLVQIEDLYNGVDVIEQTVSCDTDTLKLQTGQVTAVMDNGVKPVFRLTTALGRQIEATGNHPFYTFDGWRQLDDLEPGDRLAVPRSLPVEGQVEWPDYQVIVLGHLLAEGNLRHPHSVYYYTQDNESLSDYMNAVEQFGNVTCSVSFHKNTHYVYAKRIRRNEEPGVVVWAKKMGLWGKNARQKEIPAPAFTLKNNQIALLLGRLWAGDGHIGRQPRNSIHAYYATASERLARQVQHLLLRLSIVSSLRQALFPYRGGRVGYQVHVMGAEHIQRFAATVGQHLLNEQGREICAELLASSITNKSARDTIPMPVKSIVRAEKAAAGITWIQLRDEAHVAPKEFYPTHTPSKKGFRRGTIARLAAYFDSDALRRYANSDIYWDKVASVEYVGEKQTFNLTVANTHNFIANDILVHNSHAADYAVITCQTAYLKAWYPLEYMTALLTVERHNTAKVALYVSDCRRMGIEVRPPNINASGSDFVIEERPGSDPTIRFGLSAIKNVGEGAVELVLQARREGGRFRDLDDLAERVDLRKVGKRAIECLIQVGALESLGGNCSQQLQVMDRMIRVSQQSHNRSGQLSMFSFDAFATPSTRLQETLPDALPMDEGEKMALEKELVGFYLTAHPMQKALDELGGLVSSYSGDLGTMPHKKFVIVAGIVSWIRPITTKKGKPMAMVGMEDLQGTFELVVFPKGWERYREMVAPGKVLLVRGEVDNSRGDPKILVKSLDDRPAIYRPAGGEGKVLAEPPPPDFPPADDSLLWEPPPPPPPEWETLSSVAPAAPQSTAGGQCITVVLLPSQLQQLKPLMRQVVEVLARPDGADHFRLQVEGLDFALHFPNSTTHWSPQLQQQLSGLSGVRELRVG